jgi:membrane protease YdiL (CAAX protease family)
VQGDVKLNINHADNGKYFAVALITSTLVYLWPIEYWLGHRHWTGPAVILANFLLCLEYNRRYGAGPSAWGFSPQDFFPALGWTVLFTIPVLLAIAAAGWHFGTVSGRNHPMHDLSGLFLWALAQQFALQTVLLQELRRRIRPPWAVAAAAVLFALLHLPNPFLVPLTFLGGWIWCWVYSRHPNIIPLALSHSLCSLAILVFLSRELTGSMRVGFSYFLL